jgi:flagellar biosynthesis GTPase FlhF
MSATCRFCEQQFSNAQAVRAHLKACAAYQNRPGSAQPKAARLRHGDIGSNSVGNSALGNALGDDIESTFDPVRELQQRVASGRLTLQLREVEDALTDRERRAQDNERERQRAEERAAGQAALAEREQEEARRAAADAAIRQERREAAELERRKKRRDVIQEVKRQAVDNWYYRLQVASDVKARILTAIEQALSPLPVEDLPIAELVQIAEGVRDPIYRAVKNIEDQATKSAAQRVRLMQHGNDYAARELRAVEGLSVSDRWRIEALVKRELEAVAGSETNAEIEDWVDDIFEDEGIEADDEDGDDDDD